MSGYISQKVGSTDLKETRRKQIMIFNYWRSYPRRKPKEDGFYLCMVRFDKIDLSSEPEYLVRQLYYNARMGKWIDKSRLSVFEGYDVYKCCRARIEDNRVYTDRLCERDDVSYWKKLPKMKKVKRV